MRTRTVTHARISTALQTYLTLVAANNDIDQAVFEDIDSGVCYGLSLIYGAMVAVRQADWWSRMLYHLVAWSRYCQAMPHGLLPTDNQTISLFAASLESYLQCSKIDPVDFSKATLDKVVNYVMYHQTIETEPFSYFYPQGRRLGHYMTNGQINFLMSHSQYFELEDDLRKIYSIQHHEAFMVSFAHKMNHDRYVSAIKHLLSVKSNDICLVSSCNHTVWVGYRRQAEQGDQWLLYDANDAYPYEQVHAHQIFADINQLMQLLREKLGNNLVINCLSLQSPTVACYKMYRYVDSVFRSSYLSAMQNDINLNFLMEFSMLPHHKLRRWLNATTPLIKQARLLVLAQELVRQEERGLVGWHVLIRDAPSLLTSVLKETRRLPKLKHWVAVAFALKDHDVTGLHYALMYSRHVFKECLALAHVSDHIRQAFIRVMQIPINGVSGTQAVKRYAPSLLTAYQSLLAPRHHEQRSASGLSVTHCVLFHLPKISRLQQNKQPANKNAIRLKHDF